MTPASAERRSRKDFYTASIKNAVIDDFEKQFVELFIQIDPAERANGSTLSNKLLLPTKIISTRLQRPL
jgi:hypothetical protein